MLIGSCLFFVLFAHIRILIFCTKSIQKNKADSLRGKKLSAFQIQSLIRRHTVPEYLILTDRSARSLTLIVPITFNGIDITVFYFPNDSGVIRLPVKSVFRPIVKDNHTGRRLCRTVKPLPALLKPIYAGGSPAYFGITPVSI